MPAEQFIPDNLSDGSPSISLCMIVKNEESFLPKCLESVKHWVDEIVIVDTGSTDRTAEIAINYGARVYHHPWEDDFSKHRNQSISYARGDWILVMDADEMLQNGDGPKIRNMLSGDEFDSLRIKVISFFNQGTAQALKNQIRFFRRQPHIKYEGIVHNQLRGCRSTRSFPLCIYHYGYDLSTQDQQAKFKRTSNLLKRQIVSDPENYWHRHNLAACYATNFMFKAAVEEGMKALALLKEQGLDNPNAPWTYYTVAASHLKLNELARAEELAIKGLSIWKDYLDCHFVLILAYHQQKRWDELERHARDFFRIIDEMDPSPERFTQTVIHSVNEGWRVRLAMGDLYLERNEFDQAQAEFETALFSTPVPWECLKIIADCYKNRCLWERSSIYYRKAVAQKSDYLDAILGLALACKRMGEKRNAFRYYKMALEQAPDSVEAQANLADLYYDRGEDDFARNLYERVLSVEPNLIQASLRLANLSVRRGDIEECVTYCENILKSLGLSCNHELESLSDLARLFLIIGHELDKAEKVNLFKEAMEVAVRIDPELIQG